MGPVGQKIKLITSQKLLTMQKFAAFAILAVSTEAVKTKKATDYIGAIVEHVQNPNAGKFIVHEGEDNRSKFVQWAATASANYNSQEEMDAAETNFAEANDEILRDNAAADASGDPHAARHDHNNLSGLSLDDKHKMLGVQPFSPERETELLQLKA